MAILLLPLLLAVAGGALLLLLYARWSYGVLERLGIPVVPPKHLFLGSLPDLHTKVQQLEDIERFRTLGPVFGVYEGREPQVHVCDPDMVRRILVQDYDHFREREPIDLGHGLFEEVLDIQPYDKWKELRSLWTPLFSSSRVKAMGPEVERIAAKQITSLVKQAEAEGFKPLEINARTVFTNILVEVLTTCMHGVRFQDEQKSIESISQIMKAVLREGVQYNWGYNLTLVFPFLKKILSPFRSGRGGLDSFHGLIRRFMGSRTREGLSAVSALAAGGRRDFTDMLLKIQRQTNKSIASDVNEFTATAQALELYFGLYDSTGTVLTLLIYYLAMNPDVQERLMEEIDGVNNEDDENDDAHEKLSKLPYLTACLNETMRLSPPFLRAERICTQDWIYDEGSARVRIPAGMRVLVPLYALHRNPESFPNPDEFNPSRFMDGTAFGFAFSPFGQGPKSCVGTQFAYVTMKLVCCEFFRSFTIEAVEGVTKLAWKPGTLLAAQYEPIIVNVLPRKAQV